MTTLHRSLRYPILLPILIVLSILSVVIVLWLGVDAATTSGLEAALQQSSEAIAQYPWVKVAMIDFSLMIALVSIWILNREPLGKGIFLVVLLWMFGSALLGAYLLFCYLRRPSSVE